MFEPKLTWKGLRIKTVESHTMGEPTRIITSGFPKLVGKSMMEKKQYLEKNYDQYRCALMLEPRGHNDMFGALLTKPSFHNSKSPSCTFYATKTFPKIQCTEGSEFVLKKLRR